MNWKYDNDLNQVMTNDGKTIVMSFGKSASKNDKLLIASAPELLESLKDLVLWANIKDGSAFQNLRDNALKVIAKAEKK